MKKHFILLMAFSISAMAAFAQKELIGLPYSFDQKNISQSVDNVAMPAVDKAALLQEDEERAVKGELFRVGVSHQTHYTLDNCGRTDIMPDGGKLWRVNFQSEGAIMMSVIFDKFNLPDEGKMYIYSPDHEQVFGPYTNEDIQPQGKMVTDDIYGDEVVVEYYEPANAAFHGEIEICDITHLYRDIFQTKSVSEEKGDHGTAHGNCHINVACPEGDPWRAPINSVVCILSNANGYQYLCSGATVNNVRMDKTLYVLSANHCIESESQTFKFYFFYQTNTCNGDVGNSRYVANGGTIVARSSTYASTHSTSDFLLLRITGNVGMAYRDSIVFAGWDRSGMASVGAAIHHPRGDWKKISIPKSVSDVTSGELANKFFAVNWYLINNKGVTEPGSSGSPLFNANSLIIGTLTSGLSACDSLWGTDHYGKMSYHWLNNGATDNARKLQPWLDPDNTGATYIPSMRYDGTIVTGVQDYELESSTFEVVPNPTSNGMVTVKGNFQHENAVCNIYNVMGQLVMSCEVTTDATFPLNLSHLNNGIYIMHILGSSRNYNSKLIIAK